MSDEDLLAEEFEAHRARLRSVAYRMLGTVHEADDAVQEAWLRLQRSDGIDNLGGWLTTVVSRVCLDMLRSRSSRREDPFTDVADEPATVHDPGHPEFEAELADSVGSALLVVLQSLAPAERLAFVLHDMFAVPFDEIGAIIGRSPLPRDSSPAAPGGVSSDPMRCPSPVTGRWSMRSWQRPAAVTSPACWRCSTLMRWSWPTRPPCGWDPTRWSPERGRWPRPSPAGHGQRDQR